MKSLILAGLLYGFVQASAVPSLRAQVVTPKPECAALLEKSGPRIDALGFKLLKTPKHINHLPLLGDRIVVRLSRDYSDLNASLLSTQGRQILRDFLRTVNPMETFLELAERFQVSREAAQQLIFVDGDSLIRRMFEARDRQDWDEVIRIYDGPLRGPWQTVAEAKLQAALALNRRNQGNDRARALQFTDEVIRSARGRAILSEAYGIRGRIYNDMGQTETAIETYKLGFSANPMDFYPGSAAISLMLSLGTPKAVAEANEYAALVQLAIDSAHARYREKNQPPDFWLLSTSLNLLVLRRDWERTSEILPEVLASAGGPQNLQTVIEGLERVANAWRTDRSIAQAEHRRMRGVLDVLKRAMRQPEATNPLSENALSYVTVQKFPEMEGAFGTAPFNLREEIRKSGVESELMQLARKGEVHVHTFHEFLQKGAQRGLPKNSVLLAPTGPYRAVMQVVSDHTGLIPWWDAYGQVGLDLNPSHSQEFLERLAEQGRDVYLLVPRDFRGATHAGSHTLREFEYIVSQFEKLRKKVHFVFGFENTFPLDYRNRLSPREVHRNYRDNIMRLFTSKYQAWLVGLGDRVKHYSFGSMFSASQYPIVYDQALAKLPAHIENRELHSRHMARGTAQSPVRILDLGGGTGLVARKLMNEPGTNRVVEIFDMSEAMTNVAIAKGMPKNRVHISDITSLVRRNGSRIADASVDGAVSNNVVYLLTPEEIHQLFAEVLRVLKPGGRFSLSSMLKAGSEVHQAFLASVSAQVRELEKLGQVPAGSDRILFSSNQNLLQRSPTMFTHEEIVRIGLEHGFRVVVNDGVVYEGAGFFVVFEKP